MKAKTADGANARGGADGRRNFLKSAAVVAGAVVAPVVSPRVFAQTPKTVKFTLPWLAQGATAYVYVADAQGMFKKRGINIDISRGFGSITASQTIGAGQFDFGLVSTGATILGAANGLPLVATGTTNYDAYMGILVLADSPIKTPKDLEGKKLGGIPPSAEFPFWPAFAKKAGIDTSKITIVQTDARVAERVLVDRQVDALICITSTSYAVAKSIGAATRAILWSNYGLSFYSNNIVTRPEVLARDPKLCQDVTDALLEALAFCARDPEGALDIFIRKVPELGLTAGGREFARLSQGFMLASMVMPEAIENGLGYTNMARVGEMTNLVMDYAVTSTAKRPAVDALFTNRFIGAIKLSPSDWSKVRQNTEEFPKLLAG